MTQVDLVERFLILAKMNLIYGYHTNKFTSLGNDSCGLPAIPYWMVYKKDVNESLFRPINSMIGRWTQSPR